jgi:hypothetical protein
MWLCVKVRADKRLTAGANGTDGFGEDVGNDSLLPSTQGMDLERGRQVEEEPFGNGGGHEIPLGNES